LLDLATLLEESFSTVDSRENREAHASHAQATPGAQVSVRAAKRRVRGRSAAENLDGDQNGGYAAPPVDILSFARDFSLETHHNINQGMRATLFLLCLLILGSILGDG
jgi:hypothetical protein